MEDYLQYKQCIPKAKCNGLIYTEWPDEKIQGLWIYEHGVNWICIYQHKMKNSNFISIDKHQRKTAILKSVLTGGIHFECLQEWINKFQMKPTQFFTKLKLLSINQKKEKIDVSNSFITIYTQFLQTIQSIIKLKVCLYICVYNNIII